MSTDGQQSSSSMPDPNAVKIETDSSGVATGYKCDYHVHNGEISASGGVVKDTYYDMKYPCNLDPEEGMKRIAAAVLNSIAKEFRILPDGHACTVPDTSQPFWLIGESSEPSDSIVGTLSCQNLSTDGEPDMCCSVVHAPMTFWWTGGVFGNTNTGILEVLSQHFDSDTVSDPDFEISYLGAFMEPGVFMEPMDEQVDETDLPPAINQAQEPQQVQPTPSARFTVIGGFVLAGLLAAIVGAVVIIVLRRRRTQRAADVELAVAKSGDMGLDDDGTASDGPTLEVDVMSDDYPQHPGYGGEAGMVDGVDPYDDGFNTPSSYRFDLADSMKHDVMGTYGDSDTFGPTSIDVVPPYPMEDTSDSEVDSWAQTEGTVGSLEERLEEITAEI